jgi:tetratricopeptide (TPR) repeat protein
MAAVTLMFEQGARGVPLAAEERAEAVRLADRAARAGGDDAFALARAGHVLTYLGRQYDRGMAMTERAVGLNPNLAVAWNSRGWVTLMSDQPQQSIESFERMIRLSPLDHLRARAWNGTSFAWFALRRHEEGCEIALKSLQVVKNAHTLSAYIMNAVGAGRDAEAKRAVDELLATQPGFRASHVGEAFPVRSVEVSERMATALRAAGLPA